MSGPRQGPRAQGKPVGDPVGMELELIEIGQSGGCLRPSFLQSEPRPIKMVVGAELNRPAEQTNFTRLFQTS